MIGRLEGILVMKQPPWAKPHVCEPLARVRLSARAWMPGQGVPEPMECRHGWQPLETFQ